MFKIGDFSKLAQVSVKALRYYDKLGLLKPAWIDRFTGYRYYAAEQLTCINRILALKDLGFSLDQVQQLLSEDLPVAELRGMMRMKQADLEHLIQEEQDRLERVETRLRQIESEGALPEYDVVLKTIPPQKVAGIRDVIPGYGDFAHLYELLRLCFDKQNVELDSGSPYLAVYYDREYHDQGIDVELAVPFTGALVCPSDILVHELPGVESMACVVYQGGYDELPKAHSLMMTWIEMSGYRVDGPNRDVYVQAPEPGMNAADRITEVQFPIVKKPVLTFISHGKETIDMEPKIMKKTAFTVVGMKYYGKNEKNEIPQLWGVFNPRIKEINNIVGNAFGVCGSPDESGAFKYLAGMEVSSDVDMPKGMESWDVPGQKYAVFPCTLKTIHETYKYAFDTWLPASEYEYTHGPDFEYYDESFDTDGRLYIYIPVK